MTLIPEDMQQTRATLAARYLAGQGIEIGALDYPLAMPATANVKYIDRVSVSELRRYYPELTGRNLVEPDVIEDGEQLGSFADASLDFIVANHMLEHCENPLGTLRVHLNRVRSGGVLFYAIPDKRQCFDKDRPLTDLVHLISDDRDGGAASRKDHFLEWATQVNAIADPDAAEENARENMRNNYSIHFHVWDPGTFRQFLEAAPEYLDIGFQIEHFQVSGSEIIAVLRRQ